MKLDNILNILENKEYIRVEKGEIYVSMFYQFYTKNGGIIRILHYNKVLFSKEKYEIILFTPNKKDAVKCFTIKSDSEYFKRVDDIWHRSLVKEQEQEQEKIEKYFL